MRRATEGSRPTGLVAGISIHALHEESEVQLDIFVRFLRRKPAA